MNLNFLTSLDLLFYVIFGLAILSGVIRGLKKTLFSFVTMLIFYALFFLTINQVVSILWTMEMPWLGGLLAQVSPDLSGFTSFSESLPAILGTFLGDTIDLSSMNEEVMVIATGLGMFVLKIVYTILYFTVILLIYKLLCFIIRVIFFGKSKQGASKNRGLGAVFGALNGAMAVFVALIMLGGVMSVTESLATIMNSTNLPGDTDLTFVPRREIYQASYSVIPLAETDLPDITEELELMNQLIENYHNNIFVSLAEMITVPVEGSTLEIPLHLSLFDSVLSFDIDEQNIAIRYELSVFSEVLNVFLQSDFYESQEISDITGDEIREAFSILSNSKLITSILPVAIEVGAEMYETPLNISAEDLYSIDYQAELENLGAISGTLFDILNSAGVVGGNGSIDEIEVTGDLVRDLFGDFADSSLVVLLASNLLVPYLDESEGDIKLILDIPADLDWEAEFIAIGEVLGEVLDADVTVSDIMGGDPNILLQAVSKIDLTVLMESEIITGALINILSGEAGIEGLELLTIPADIVWRDTFDEFGNLETPGELKNILIALNALTGSLADFDINNLGLDTISNLSDDDIDDIFNSRVFVATISDLLLSEDLGDLPLVVPDAVLDEYGYLLKEELKALAKSIALIVTTIDDETSFDVQKILAFSDTDLDTLMSSQIISSTIGKMIYDMNTDPLVVPSDVIQSVLVDGLGVNVVSSSEITALIKSIQVLGFDDFDNFAFDASIISSLELIPPVGDPVTLDDDLIEVLLDSKIVHATVSKMIIDLGSGTGSILIVPTEDQDGTSIKFTTFSTEYLTVSEIGNMLKALYAIDITDFDSINLEDTSLILTHQTELLASAIIHATVSDIILGLGSGSVTIPYEDDLGNDVIIETASATFIEKTELGNLFDALDLMGITDPSSLTNSINLSTFALEANQNTLLDSAIMQATISKTLFDIGDTILIIPLVEEDGITPVQVETGPLGNETTFVVKAEIKALINALLAMGYSDLDSFTTSISSTSLFDNSELILLSSSLQATLSDQLTNVSSGTLVIPTQDEFGTDIRVNVVGGVEYVTKVEIQKIIDALELLGLTDLSTFDLSPATIFSVDFNDLLESATMQATVSYYILENALDETSGPGQVTLIVPTALREGIMLDGVVDASEQIEKTELIALLTALQTLGISDFSGSMDASIVSGLSNAQLDTLLASGSMHITVDNMLKGNANINTQIPALAQETIYGIVSVTTVAEIKAFIIASNTLAAGDFTSASFSYAAIASLSAGDRDIVLDSMIVRNILTDQLETLMTSDDPFDLYWPANTSYMNNDPLTFLTEAGINEVLTHYGLI